MCSNVLEINMILGKLGDINIFQNVEKQRKLWINTSLKKTKTTKKTENLSNIIIWGI